MLGIIGNHLCLGQFINYEDVEVFTCIAYFLWG
jgi:hypothetical protein